MGSNQPKDSITTHVNEVGLDSNKSYNEIDDHSYEWSCLNSNKAYNKVDDHSYEWSWSRSEQGK